MGGGVRCAAVLGRALSAAWAAFARSGDPNNPQIPHWPPYAPTSRETLIFDERIRVEKDPDADLHALWAASPLPTGVLG